MQTSPRVLISQTPMSELGRQCDLIEISGTRDCRNNVLELSVYEQTNRAAVL